MRDICRFITNDAQSGAIDYIYFVYEAEIKKLKQPFFHSNYYLYLVSKGTGKLVSDEKEYDLKPGTLFLVAPWHFHEIKDTRDFTYLYISFNGQGVQNLFKKIGYGNDGFVLNDFEHLIEFWIKCKAVVITILYFYFILTYLLSHFCVKGVSGVIIS